MRSLAASVGNLQGRNRSQANTRRLLGMRKPELQNEWKEMKYSDSPPMAQTDLLATLVHHLYCNRSDSYDVDLAADHLRHLQETVSRRLSRQQHLESFKEAVTSYTVSFKVSTTLSARYQSTIFIKLQARDCKQRFEALDQDQTTQPGSLQCTTSRNTGEGWRKSCKYVAAGQVHVRQRFPRDETRSDWCIFLRPEET